MALQICESCRKVLPPDVYDLFDFCGVCRRTLCDACMKKGCCEETPAKSGLGEDQEEGQ